ncbi:DNA primase family protein [Schleiferilactobacillus perolens]|uniref:SF3 helicase domain-containing protein n=1 Tax=Schleiferilactobacillus perolens DSM 12744 TaxID=1423792 RepID=A0A0R1MY10_9LACO|nr:DNA primase family protein [Schleiferilactobacillus perolens]KRL13047.1 hypothetical protein FD09_GL002587 [Schleiferilactobacillus perolens DSM 12744]
MLEQNTESKPNPELHIAMAPSRKTKKWSNKVMLWSDLLDRLSHPTITPETMAEWAKMSREQQEEIKDVGGFVGGWLKQGRRKVGSVQNRSLLTLDVDFPDHNLWDDAELLWGFSLAVYSTHKYRPDNPRMRFVIPLSRVVTAEEYVPLARKVASELGMNNFDDSTYEPERLMFWPSHSQDAEYFYRHQDGELLDPDKVLGEYTDWQDSSFWPVSDREAEVHQHEAKMAGDPLTKPGAIGAFNRVYPIREAIEKFLPDVYAPTRHPDRYTYIPGSTVGGLVLYDDQFAYSHHGTDPTGGQLTNAFDLVRLHKFNDLDAKAKDGTPVNKLPSTKAMTQFALEDKGVNAEWKQDVIGTADDDFDTWEDQEDGAEADKTKDLAEWLTITDKGNPVINTYHLAEHVIAEHPLFFDKREFLRYDDKTGIWRDDTDTYLTSILTKDYLRKLTKINLIRETKTAIQGLIKADDPFPAPDTSQLVLANGIYNWQDNTFSEGYHPDLHARAFYPVQYDHRADCPTFDGYARWLLGEENMPFIYEWIGYMFFRGYPIQKMLFLYGGGGTGKSTLINVIRNAIGEQASAAVTLEALMTKPFAPAGLYQKTANFDSDAKSQYLEDGAILKTLTGEDITYADVKFSDPLKFYNFAKLTFSMNKLPAMRDFSGGLTRRAIILKINRKVTPEIIKQFPLKQMLKEAPGIFNRAMDGLRRLIKSGSFTESSMMERELQDWVIGNDQVGRFVTEAVNKVDGQVTTVEDMYNAYTNYSMENGEKALGRYKFGQRLEELGLTRTRKRIEKNPVWIWQDVKLAVSDFD